MAKQCGNAALGTQIVRYARKAVAFSFRHGMYATFHLGK
jgi:hypothetical protein